MKHKIVYRQLRESDIDTVVQFAREHAKEIPSWGDLGEADLNIMRRSILLMIPLPTHFKMGVWVDDKFVGGLMCEISPTWFSTRWESNGRTIYLLPECRGKGIAKRLYVEFDKWANKFPLVTHGGLQTTSGVDIMPLIKFMGYEYTGRTYRKKYVKNS